MNCPQGAEKREVMNWDDYSLPFHCTSATQDILVLELIAFQT